MMREFYVKFVSPSGRKESRTILAFTEIEAARQLIIAGDTPLHIRERRGGMLEKLSQPVSNATRLRHFDIALFAEHMAEMLKAGVTVEQALDLLSRQNSREQIAALAGRLLGRVRTGQALSHALTEEKSIPKFFSGLVRGSEQGGRLPEGLSYLSDYLMRQAGTRSKIIATLTYPAIVVATSILALFFVLVVVIPEFTPLFAGEEKNLPFVTRLVVGLSDIVNTDLPYLIFVALGIPAAAWAVIIRVESVRRWAEMTAARLPPVDMAHRLDLSKVIRVMGALLESGIDASQAVTLAAESATSARLNRGFLQVGRRLREGARLSDALRSIGGVPETQICLIAVGEQTGELGIAAMRAANLLELETNRRIEQLVSLVNPIAVVVLGVMIAVLIAGVMLGILSANQFVLR